MNADDVLFSLERQWKDDHPYHDVGGSNYDYLKDMGMPELLQSIEKLDDATVRFRLTRPSAPFLADLAMPFNIIQSAEYGDQLLKAGTPEKIDTNPIGTGPFQFVGFQPDIAVRYRAFPDYWGGKVPIDALVFSITPNASVRLNKLKAGECHVIAFPRPGDRAAIEADSNLKFLEQEGFNIGYLAMNTTRPPFDDVRVRRAINLAIDKAAIIEAVYQGAGVVAKNPIPPTLWSYNDDIEDYPYDPAAAQRLMIEAGLAEGFDTDLWYIPVSRPYNPNGKRVAELIQYDLAKIGIRATLVSDEWSAYRQKLQDGDTSMALYGWTGDNGDPVIFSMCSWAAPRRASAATTSAGGATATTTSSSPTPSSPPTRPRASASTARHRSSSTTTRRGYRSPIQWCSWRRAPTSPASRWTRSAATPSRAWT